MENNPSYGHSHYDRHVEADKKRTTTNPSTDVKRCAKCNGPFLDHHWQHFSPRENKTYHTGCFEQYKFPALLSNKEREVREKVVEFIKRHGYPLEKTEFADHTFYRVSEVVLEAATHPKP